MDNVRKEVTMEELGKLVQSQEGEFLICVEQGEGESNGAEKSVSA